MSNGTNTPQGLSVIKSNIGNGGTQKLTAYTIYPNADPTALNPLTGATFSIFSGDPVVWQPAQVRNAANDANIVNVAAGTIMPAYNNSQPGVAAAVRNNITVANVGAAGSISGILGIFISCTYKSAQSNLVLQQVPYWPMAGQVAAGEPVIAYINDDPEVIFQVQVSSSLANQTGIVYLTSWNGLNANLSIGGITFAPNAANYAQNPQSGNTANGLSAYYLDGSTAVVPTTGAALAIANSLFDVRIIGFAPPPQGFGNNPTNLITGVTLPFVNVLCKFNNHVYSQGTVSVFNRA